MERITVTSPLLPDLDEFHALLKQIWDKKWITNNGSFHRQLERELAEYLGVPYISLFTNGTLPLITALQALHITGEVITTPYSFVATTHSIWWNGAHPVFVDVDPLTGNIDPDKIEGAITPRTTAIMPVHVYGKPCDVERIDTIAKKYNLKVIYDAAHAFGVTHKGKNVLEYGDLSTLSFHATKVYNTIEGGAMIMHDAEMKQRIDYLKNFGFAGETEVVGPGINSKMDEIRSAYGILNLRQVDSAIAMRRKVARQYVEALKGIEGLTTFPYIEESFGNEEQQTTLNYSYFPIFVDEKQYGMSRDELYFKMKDNDVLGRRYFYPLISTFATYRTLPSANPQNLPNAHRLADTVICLPIHHALSEAEVNRIISLIKR
ncbi:MAG: DegT/DnrJ/EryC1/StrS family aminotransferase [Bacteroidaceae bacterium]|nr:DegT/DnrJ/EryC1/StrS family aminotransferase [Bacteroidaceae bacterium]